MLYLLSPSTSGKSLVIAITVAKTVTKEVMNLQTAAAVTQIAKLQYRYVCFPTRATYKDSMTRDGAAVHAMLMILLLQ